MGRAERLLHPTVVLLDDLGTLGHAPKGTRCAVLQGCCGETWSSSIPSEEEVVQGCPCPASPPRGSPHPRHPQPQGMGRAAPAGVNLPLGAPRGVNCAPSQGSQVLASP